MVVARHDPGKRRMRELQIGITFIERVTVAIVFERDDLRAIMLARAVSPGPSLVDVIAEVYDQIETLVRHVSVRGEVSGFVMLARSEGETEIGESRVESRRGPRSSHRADGGAGHKAVPVPSPWLQPANIHMR